MTIATALFAVALAGPAGCGKSDPVGSGPNPSATVTAVTAPSPSPAAKLVGDWHDTAAQWTVHFKDDGTFVEDFQGITEFRVGTYTSTDTTVSLIGDDGNTDKGTITGKTLVFRLGTLTRV